MTAGDLALYRGTICYVAAVAGDTAIIRTACFTDLAVALGDLERVEPERGYRFEESVVERESWLREKARAREAEAEKI